jgi:hypothetical protein
VTGVFGGLLTGGRFDLSDGVAPEVTLRAPVPLDRPLSVEVADSKLSVHDGPTLIAEAVLTSLALEIPPAPSWDAALAEREHSAALVRAFHPWLREERLGFHPICFCCGAELLPERGLHVYSAPLGAAGQVAAAWIAPAGYAAASGVLPAEIVCAALDCPGQFAWLAAGTRTGMLGRLTVRIDKPVRAGERCVITGWTIANEGRKYFAGTALFNADGELCAYGKAVWIGKV